mmetsp:Transcript_581/g.999  ORF Transcript_581/g.999 Transcript_581/m.999 type:complete len:729 (+) Transcript_581:599-2785(+)|eukprot:CAMPEP_0196135112 /NCGR_PEP_ID=MMETSP0910-20130528/3862_1 /TAXON_ID=49265 /ORGANISM="Thalassiosira rotula, Strain GSO102" /LENGTH=728 /DNA_ID=CAMNT_0041395203 /DNA_START=483 /DNA_END=2669 /DNA_ORIENTATION=-
MKQANQIVMLADTFPAKTHLLITCLTDTDPLVASFSSDGTSFEIYDQSLFAQKYLPQYFKHSNYGSFVRQLNLYGFTSSRLKRGNAVDVVVWFHEFFHRDRKELARKIKRAKKAKSTKPSSHANSINSSSTPPPPPLADVNIPSPSDNTNITKPAITIAPKGGSSLGSHGSGVDQSWLESEFSYLKQHNKFLERKLDALIKITLRISSSATSAFGEAPWVGEKRRRMSPVESHVSSPLCERGSIYLEEKLSDEDIIYRIDGEEKAFDWDCYGIEPAPYKGDRKFPPEPAPFRTETRNSGASNHEIGRRDDSLKRFSDVTMNEEDLEKHKAVDAHLESSIDPKLHAEPPAYNATSLENIRLSDSADLDDELTEEARGALFPGATIDTDGDLFASEHSADQPTQTVTMINRADDKAGGARPIHSISSDIPTAHTIPADTLVIQGGDIEEGGLPVGVTVIAALMDDDQDGNMNSNNEACLLEQERERCSERRDRKKTLYLLAFIGVALAIGITWPAVVLTKQSHVKKSTQKQYHTKLDIGSKKKKTSSKSKKDKHPHGLRPDNPLPCEPGHNPPKGHPGHNPPPGHPNHNPPKGHPGHDPNGLPFPLAGCDLSSDSRPPTTGQDSSDRFPSSSKGSTGYPPNSSRDSSVSKPGSNGEDHEDAGQIVKVENSTEQTHGGHLFDTSDNTIQKSRYHIRRKRINSIFDDANKGILLSFSVKLEGTEFLCNSHNH